MLWGYAITGIVGIVGTSLGAWLTGRWQTMNLRLSIETEDKRTKFAERRQLYASFHSAFHSYLIAATSSLGIKEEPGRTLYNEALQTFMDVGDQISVTAPPRVKDLTIELTQIVFDYADERKLDPDSPIPDKLNAVRGKLINAMRKDLGIDN